MMKACAEATRPHKIKTMVSLNPIMVDGTGMCGGCRVKIGDQVKFACVDGPDFDGHLVDFDDLMARLRRYTADRTQGARALVEESCRIRGDAAPAGALEARRQRALVLTGPVRAIQRRTERWPKKKTIRTIPQERTPMREQDPKARAKNFDGSGAAATAWKTRCARRSAA